MLGNKYGLGYKESLEHRDKIRQARLSKPHPNRGHQDSPETREKKRQRMLGNKQWLGHKHSPEAREKMRQSRLRQVFPKKMTSIERLLHDEFKKRRLHFEMHKTMFGRFQPDFVFESARLIVQADGDYWHNRPEVKTRDAAFNQAAAEGWSVWRFGEREIKMHAPACARAVAKFIRSH
jgi:very-short-patch-repair endonuclease